MPGHRAWLPRAALTRAFAPTLAVIVVPRALIPNGAAFNFTVTVTDFVPRTDQATITVEASSLPTPTVTLLTPATLSV